ncbi:MAG: indole-3-glycerol-phosphate synthase [Symbiobacteriaceae bacterium]|nr:indole-3-glycerol-phosphate synthase [Symbiobacteriaceae bacterium]
MILDRILATKRQEVAAAYAARPLAEVKAAAAEAPAPRGFRRALAQPAGIQVIAEVKKASPSKGVIRPDFDPVAIARAYESAGAACLSVLTDEQYFQGSLSYLPQIRSAVSLPLLRKEFIIDPYQIYEARAVGADTALGSSANLIGINNRDLKTFYTSLDVTLGLAPRVGADRLLVSESGISSRDDLLRLEAAGAKAVLVGESLMRQPDVAAALRQLRG